MKLGLVLALGVLAVPFLAPCSSLGESHSLLPKVKVGDRIGYDYRAATCANGAESVFTAHFDIRVKSLEPKGTIVFATHQSAGEFTSAGSTRKSPDTDTTTQFKLNGELLSTDPPYATPTQARFGQLIQVVVPNGRASVGTVWSWSTPASDVNGKVGVRGKGECVGFETHMGVRCAKLNLSATETSGEKPAKSAIAVWVSLKDGLPVETAIELTDFPFGPSVTGSLKAENKRSNPTG